MSQAQTQENKLYQTALKKIANNDRSKLEENELAWEMQRDKTCLLDSQGLNSAASLHQLENSDDLMVCELFHDRDRIFLLQSMLLAGAPKVPSTFDVNSSEHQFISKFVKNTGLLYFEVTVNGAGISHNESTALAVGCAEKSRSKGNVVLIYAKPNLHYESSIIGFAMDFYNDRFYYSQNGQWQNGYPSIAGGAKTNYGSRNKTEVVCAVHSTTPINSLLDQGVLDVNFGEQPFVLPLPQGYQALSSPPMWLPFATESNGQALTDYRSIQLADDPPSIMIRQIFSKPEIIETGEVYNTVQGQYKVNCQDSS